MARAGDQSRGATESAGVVWGALVGAMGVGAWFGFTVDDAWITARVAHHLATGAGYRFNAEGPVVDAVTPLGWAVLLAPFAQQSVLGAWQGARGVGIVAFLLAMVWLGRAVQRVGVRPVRWLPLLLLPLSMPLGAWVGAGMETGVVIALTTFAALDSRWAPVAAGLATAWRPELGPWALTLAVGGAWARGTWEPGALAGAVVAALGPAVVVAGVRQLVFGHPAPLAALAKPSGLGAGAYYALGSCIWTGMMFWLLAPRALARGERHPRVLALAAVVHLGALTLAGGDWMPLFRLFVPVLPSLVLAGAAVAERAPLAATLGRAVCVLVPSVILAGQLSTEVRAVATRRLELVAAARPVLAGARRVAALDVGWVGATGVPWVVDLAGVTDPTIAVLPGGHTTKRVPHDLVDTRDVDLVVVLVAHEASTPDEPVTCVREVEARIASDALERGFVPVARLPLPGTTQHYLVLARSAR